MSNSLCLYIHGTYSSSNKKHPWESDENLLKDFGSFCGASSLIMPNWNGSANGSDRLKGAVNIFNKNKELFEFHDKVHIMAHSHGGNVAGHLVKMLSEAGIPVGIVILLGTPHFHKGKDMAWKEDVVSMPEQIWNIWTKNDMVQKFGASVFNICNPFCYIDRKDLGDVRRELPNRDKCRGGAEIDVTESITRLPLLSHTKLHDSDNPLKLFRYILQIIK